MIIENKPIDIKVDAQRPANYVSLMLFCYEVPSQKALTLDYENFRRECRIGII